VLGQKVEWEKVVPEAYLVLNADSAVGKVTRADCGLSPQQAAAYAVVADRYFRFPIVYIEYSGKYGDPAVVAAVSDVLEDVGYYLASGDQDARLASQIERDQAELDRLRRSIAATRTETQRTRMQVKAQYNEMVRQRDELKSAQKRLEELEAQTREAKARQVTAYNAIRKNKSQTAALLAKEKAALDGLQAQISKLIARDMGNIPSAYSGSLLWPLSGTVTQSYGCSGFALEPSRGGCGHYHNGIDIAAPMYSPIRAAGDGVVVFAGANPYDPPGARAWIVVIAHSKSLVTWYAHVDNGSRPPAVHKGQWVNQGQVVAYVGMTGRTTGPHLHWMVELNGVFSNPRLFV